MRNYFDMSHVNKLVLCATMTANDHILYNNSFAQV